MCWTLTLSGERLPALGWGRDHAPGPGIPGGRECLRPVLWGQWEGPLGCGAALTPGSGKGGCFGALGFQLSLSHHLCRPVLLWCLLPLPVVCHALHGCGKTAGPRAFLNQRHTRSLFAHVSRERINVTNHPQQPRTWKIGKEESAIIAAAAAAGSSAAQRHTSEENHPCRPGRLCHQPCFPPLSFVSCPEAAMSRPFTSASRLGREQ